MIELVAFVLVRGVDRGRVHGQRIPCADPDGLRHSLSIIFNDNAVLVVLNGVAESLGLGIVPSPLRIERHIAGHLYGVSSRVIRSAAIGLGVPAGELVTYVNECVFQNSSGSAIVIWAVLVNHGAGAAISVVRKGKCLTGGCKSKYLIAISVERDIGVYLLLFVICLTILACPSSRASRQVCDCYSGVQAVILPAAVHALVSVGDVGEVRGVGLRDGFNSDIGLSVINRGSALRHFIFDSVCRVQIDVQGRVALDVVNRPCAVRAIDAIPFIFAFDKHARDALKDIAIIGQLECNISGVDCLVIILDHESI